MQNHFISYYEHLAKLSQVANKQTMFLAHIMYHMEFDAENKQYIVDLSVMRKTSIMDAISPDSKSRNVVNLANQYIATLKKAGFIRSLGHNVWGINPTCYGSYRPISKNLRTENAKLYSTMVWGSEGIEDGSTKVEEG